MSVYFNLYISGNKLRTDLQQALPVRRCAAVSLLSKQLTLGFALCVFVARKTRER